MIVKTLTDNDQINQLCNAAMISTVNAMIAEGLITKQEGVEFMECHVSLVMFADAGFWGRIQKFLGYEATDSVVTLRAIKEEGGTHGGV